MPHHQPRIFTPGLRLAGHARQKERGAEAPLSRCLPDAADQKLMRAPMRIV